MKYILNHPIHESSKDGNLADDLISSKATAKTNGVADDANLSDIAETDGHAESTMKLHPEPKNSAHHLAESLDNENEDEVIEESTEERTKIVRFADFQK